MTRFSGAALRAAREARGLRREELALAVGLTAPTIVLYECGRRRPSLAALERLSDNLCIATDDLFERERVSA